LCGLVSAQTVSENLAQSYRVHRPDGTAATLSDIIKAMADADAVLLGETHDDPVAHHLEAELLRLAYAAYAPQRPLALSLEMFERDVQTALDEYLNDQITEDHFLKSARPWRNYADDYKPLVEFAKTHRLPVIAANAPRRYVNRVSRLGPAALADLSRTAQAWLPPLPYAEASFAYAKKFKSFMRQTGQAQITAAKTPEEEQQAQARLTRTLAAQSLWDASMAHALAEMLKARKRALVLHVNGRFHSEERMGIPEHLARYRKAARVLTVTMLATRTFPEFSAERHGQLGDFIIITDGKLPRTYQAEEPPRPKATASIEDKKHQ
jgi:uncharacterized iron-regulated protein